MSETGTGVPPGNVQSPQDAFEQMLAADEGENELIETEGEEEEVLEAEASESDAESVEQTEGDEEAEEAPQSGQTFRVKVDGEEVEVPLEELLKGYSRTADYTRKTQAIAEARRQAEAEAAAAREERQRYAQTLEALDAQLRTLQPPDIDWDRLYKENPVEWVRQREIHRRQEQASWVQAQRAALVEKQQQEEQAEQAQTLEVERAKLFEALPEWRDAEKARSEKAKIVSYATERLGFTVEEISDIYDARAVVALRKAMLFDELMSKRDQMRPKIMQKAKPMKAGAASSPQSSKVVASKAALSRLANSGSHKDAAAVFEQFID
jgi:hypothetical protein